jgi:hypothetical protein
VAFPPLDLVPRVVFLITGSDAVREKTDRDIVACRGVTGERPSGTQSLVVWVCSDTENLPTSYTNPKAYQ